MSYASMSDLTTVTANNSPAGSDNASTADDVLRAHAAIIRDAMGTVYAAGGTANAITVSVSPTFSAYFSGHELAIKIGASANTGAATINVNSLGAKAIVKGGTTALDAGDLAANTVYRLKYDGTSYQVVGGSASQATFLPSGTGAVARSVTSKLREVVSVTDFGAVGDGVADDTTAIQAALNAVSAAGGGTIVLPPGIYNISSSVQLQGNTIMQGHGESTVINVSANTTAFLLDGKSNITIKDLKIAGNRATYTSNSNHGIFIDWRSVSGGKVDIANVVVDGAAGAGIIALASSGTASSGIRIYDSKVLDSGAHGIITQDYISNVIVDNCEVTDFAMGTADRPGITVGRSGNNCHVTRCRVTGNASSLGTSSHGISLDNGTYCSANDNTVRDTTGYGIEVGFIDGGTVNSNRISGTARAAIALAGVEATNSRNQDFTVSGNALRDGTAQGIYVFMTGATGAYLHKNISIGPNNITGFTSASSGIGIQVEYVDGINITPGLISGNGLSGIYVRDCKAWTIDGGVVTENNLVAKKAVSSITLSGSTATMTIAGHGYSTNDVVTVWGANPSEYNGTKTVTVTGTDTMEFAAGVSGLLTPAVGTIYASKANSASHGGITVIYTVVTDRKWRINGTLCYGNANRDVSDVSVNGFVGVADDKLFLKETGVARAENLTSGEASNILDRAAVFIKNNKFVIEYNNTGTSTFVTLPLDGAATTWSISTSAP